MEDRHHAASSSGGAGHAPEGIAMTTSTFPAVPAPPSCMTREQTSCLKAALGFVIAKRRLQNERNRQMQSSVDRQNASSTDNDVLPVASAYRFFPPLTQWTSASSSNDEVAASGPADSTADHSRGLSFTSTWMEHLDHMMAVAHVTRRDASKLKQYRSVIQYVANQLEMVTVAATAEGGGVGQKGLSIADVRGWMSSYLVVANASTSTIWADIACAAAKSHRELRIQVQASRVPDLLVSCLVSILKQYLDLGAPPVQGFGTGDEDVYALQLLAHSLHLATPAAANDCWNQLGVDHSPVTCNYAALYQASCRRRRLVLADSRPCAGIDIGITDSSRILWIRSVLSELFSTFIKSVASAASSESEEGFIRVRPY